MLVINKAQSFKSVFYLILPAMIFWACQKKKSEPIPDVASESVVDTATHFSGQAPDSANPEKVDSVLDASPEGANPRIDKTRIAFNSNPPRLAYLGRPYLYRPAFSQEEFIEIKLAKGPDSMKVVKGQVEWTPIKDGTYSVILEATVAPGKAGGPASIIQQGFQITVAKVLTLVLKPLTPSIKKGDTLVFDLKGSAFPAWAGKDIGVRFDYEGDGKWDSEFLPLASNLMHRRAFEKAGKFNVKVQASYKSLEIHDLEVALTVTGIVTAALKISPDTVEPGAKIKVDASESIGDGQLIYSLDLNGDGKSDWSDSSTGKGELLSPKSGIYQAMLSVTNRMGAVGQVTSTVIVNARPKLEIKIKNPKANMATLVEFRVHGWDLEDTLKQVRINYTGEPQGWIIRSSPPDSVISPRDWLLRFKQEYGKVGKYRPAVCLASMDNREVCGTASVEIYNAPPVCEAGDDLRATVGIPLTIDGTGKDPDGKIVKWEWDLNSDGKFDLVSSDNGKFQYTFDKEGLFSLVLRVTTADGIQAVDARKVEVKKKWKS